MRHLQVFLYECLWADFRKLVMLVPLYAEKAVITARLLYVCYQARRHLRRL